MLSSLGYNVRLRYSRSLARTISGPAGGLPEVKQSAATKQNYIFISSLRKKNQKAKVLAVRSSFQLKGSALLPYSRPAGVKAPYWYINRKSKKPNAANKRLSVSKLLTKSWCELRKAYEIYSEIPIFTTFRMRKGTEIHKKLEDGLHVVPTEVVEFNENFITVIPQDELHKFSDQWLGCIHRLLTLFYKGECREVLCHRYMSPKNGELVEVSDITDSDVLVSGIVDNLKLLKRYAGDAICPLHETLIADCNSDIRRIADSLPRIVEEKKNNMEVVVADTKSKARRTTKYLPSVVFSQKLQVMFYINFLKEMGKDKYSTYYMLLKNAEIRGLDIDEPIHISKVIHMMMSEPTILFDLRRLRDGEPIGFEPFDNFCANNKHSSAYSYKDSIFENDSTTTAYKEFLTTWKTPVTLRYLASRMAQLYACLGPLISGKAILDYHYNDGTSSIATFDYDPEILKRESKNSGSFWFGLRDFEPPNPTVENLERICGVCDYVSSCQWRKGSIERRQTLGEELQKIQSL
ncbi:HDR042Wp [Eremothecium sinecaudum]|uniref:Exonuclease V, mitochondrial n=1 Tax=Eremothecium sinecaudum TaxID=45286 RepID=A0A0X8HST1_9SACH|nr:HDR042Wp [Eremothecium sinecaudum]AMD20784.1 HDR042Wp [Eremothecium sinecaudum]